MSTRSAYFLFASLIVARATSLPIVRLCMGEMGTFNMLALRYGLAFLCMLPVYGRKLRQMNIRLLRHAFIIASLFLSVAVTELWGLALTGSPSITTFLEHTFVIMVPLSEAALHRRLPFKKDIVSTILILSGVGLILLRDAVFTFGIGELACILCAVLTTVYIISVDRMAGQDDPLLLGFLQMGIMGGLSLLLSLFTEAPRLPQGGMEWLGIALLTLVCSLYGTTLQPYAQSFLPSEHAGLFSALNPLATTILSALLLHEAFGFSALVGGALILVGMLIVSYQGKGSKVKN
ncbi:MAG: DMT family transporter [Oscillospiraceae bacterium]|nr:DMT family transporter [Oscillospiraceae bacterium]